VHTTPFSAWVPASNFLTSVMPRKSRSMKLKTMYRLAGQRTGSGKQRGRKARKTDPSRKWEGEEIHRYKACNAAGRGYQRHPLLAGAPWTCFGVRGAARWPRPGGPTVAPLALAGARGDGSIHGRAPRPRRLHEGVPLHVQPLLGTRITPEREGSTE
jgi:hypothetical protein